MTCATAAAALVGLLGPSLSVGGIEDVDFRGGMIAKARFVVLEMDVFQAV